MKTVVFFISSLFIIQYSFSQAPSIQWQKCLGGSQSDEILSVKQIIDGGYIAAGGTSSNDGDVSANHDSSGNTFDAWVVKLDSGGTIKWQKCFGGSLTDWFTSIIQTKDSGYIATGGTASNNGDVSGNHGSADVWVVKIDSSGKIQWQKCYGGSSGESADMIQQTTDGGYIVTGSTTSTNGDVSGVHDTIDGDSWVVKIDSVGNLQWQKCLGGDATDEGVDIQPTYDGGYIVTNRSSSMNTGDLTCNWFVAYWLVKLNSTGAIQWQKCYGGSIAQLPLSGRQTTDGGYILCGYTGSDDGDVSGLHGAAGSNPDIWIVKTDSLGNLKHQKCLGGTGYDYGTYVRQTTDGGYIVIGDVSSDDGDVTGNHTAFYFNDAWVVKLDTSLNIKWEKCFGGSGDENKTIIEPTKDGGYVLAAFTGSTDGDVSGNHGGGDAWVVKLSPEIVGINNPVALNEKFSISPNPVASDELTLTYTALTEPATVRPSESTQSTISIFNTDGKEVVHSFSPLLWRGVGGEANIKIPKLASGMYFLVLQAGERRMTGRFVKQ